MFRIRKIKKAWFERRKERRQERKKERREVTKLCKGRKERNSNAFVFIHLHRKKKNYLLFLTFFFLNGKKDFYRWISFASSFLRKIEAFCCLKWGEFPYLQFSFSFSPSKFSSLEGNETPVTLVFQGIDDGLTIMKQPSHYGSEQSVGPASNDSLSYKLGSDWGSKLSTERRGVRERSKQASERVSSADKQVAK